MSRMPGEVSGSVDAAGYVRFHARGQSVYAHRLAWWLTHGETPRVVDHIDHDPFNNAISNLRGCSIRDNVRYQRPHADKLTSGFKGVDFVAHRGKWRARIVVDRKSIHLGAAYPTPHAAAKAYDTAALAHFGAFALTNAALGLV